MQEHGESPVKRRDTDVQIGLENKKSDRNGIFYIMTTGDGVG